MKRRRQETGEYVHECPRKNMRLRESDRETEKGARTKAIPTQNSSMGDNHCKGV